MADWLPAAGVEDRRWRRWMAQLLVTEALVWSEAGADPDNADVADDVVPTSNGSHPDEAARLEAAARTLFDRVTSNVVVVKTTLPATTAATSIATDTRSGGWSATF